MGRKVLALEKLQVTEKAKHNGEVRDRITITLSKADKVRYAYICAQKNMTMNTDLKSYIKKTIKREKKIIPDKVEKKIREMTQDKPKD